MLIMYWELDWFDSLVFWLIYYVKGKFDLNFYLKKIEIKLFL